MFKKPVVVLIAVFAAVALVAAACSKAEPTPVPLTLAVQVDGKASTYNSTFLAYFPNELTARPGDTVQFKLVDTGEPHTVTFGTLADQALAAAAKAAAAPNAPPGVGDAVPEMQKLPNLLPEGPGDAIQAAAQPCFLASGDPPASDACAKAQQTQPAFNGKQTFYNSGWLAPDQIFSVKLADDIAPGTYSYFCLLHRSIMSGKVTVVAKSASVATADQVKQKGADQLAQLVKALQPAADQLKQATVDHAQAGNLSQDVFNGEVNEFGPKPINIKVGGSVTWMVLGPHTIGFNVPQNAKGVRQAAPDGSVHINGDVFAPAGGPGQPAPPANAPPPDPNAPPILIDAGSWDGTGYHSSGAIISLPPGPFFAYKLTFTKAGTYKYICQIHDGMEAAVNVS